jgi:hypothetical protein
MLAEVGLILLVALVVLLVVIVLLSVLSVLMPFTWLSLSSCSPIIQGTCKGHV